MKNFQLSFAQCRRLYEDHHQCKMPNDMSYFNAGLTVLKSVGENEFENRLSNLRQDGSDKE